MQIVWVLWASNSVRKVTRLGQVLLWILNFEDLKHPNIEKCEKCYIFQYQYKMAIHRNSEDFN